MYVTGVAKRSFGRPDPVLHLVVVNGRDQTLWCTGGPGLVNQRRCKGCLALAQEYVREYAEPDDPTELDWYLGRSVPRVGTTNEESS